MPAPLAIAVVAALAAGVFTLRGQVASPSQAHGGAPAAQVQAQAPVAVAALALPDRAVPLAPALADEPILRATEGASGLAAIPATDREPPMPASSPTPEAALSPPAPVAAEPASIRDRGEFPEAASAVAPTREGSRGIRPRQRPRRQAVARSETAAETTSSVGRPAPIAPRAVRRTEPVATARSFSLPEALRPTF